MRSKVRGQRSDGEKSSKVRGQRSNGGGANFQLFRVVEIRRTWKRDGSHPEPGVVVRTETTQRVVRLRVDDVKELGLIVAMCRDQLRKIERERERKVQG